MDEKSFILRFSQKLYGGTLPPEYDLLIINSFKREVIKKKTILFEKGEGNTKHYLIEKGLLRLYINDSSGKEFNLLFAKENQVIGDLSSPAPTLFNLETIENSILYSITSSKLNTLNEYFLQASSADSMEILKWSYIFLQKRLVSILSKTAFDNFLEFKESNPDMIQRLPQYQIAAYLGVSAEFLSKIIAKTVKSR